MNQEIFTTRRFTIPAGSGNLRLPISGATLRYLDGSKPIRFKLIRDTGNEEVDLKPGMSRTFRDGVGFSVVDAFRHADFPDKSEPLSFEIGYGWGEVQDNRAVANVAATLAAPAMSIGAPLSYRLVPYITHEWDFIPGEFPRHKWTEQPGRGSVYGSPDYFGGELFGMGTSRAVCIALANPRVAKRRIKLAYNFPAWDGTSPDSASPARNPGDDLTPAFISSDPLAFGNFGEPLTMIVTRLNPGESVTIDGGSALFLSSAELVAQNCGHALQIEECFYPEEIALPAALDNWPTSGAPAKWGKMLGPVATRTGFADWAPTVAPPEGGIITPPPHGHASRPHRHHARPDRKRRRHPRRRRL